MELVSIKGDVVTLIYHPAEAGAGVGAQVALMELPDRQEGLVAQVIANETMDYDGLAAEMIQKILETRLAQTTTIFSRESGMDAIKCLKIAKAKIRKRVIERQWCAWDGWIPSRNVTIDEIAPQELLRHIMPEPQCPLRGFVRHGSHPVSLDGARLDMINIVAGVKGTGKSHWTKHLILGLAEFGVPTVVFDPNAEYVELPGAQNLRWRDNFALHLSEVGAQTLQAVVRSVMPLQQGSPSEAVFDNTLHKAFAERKKRCQAQDEPFTIDVEYLRDSVKWSPQSFVQDAIRDRLDLIAEMGLFAQELKSRRRVPSIRDIFEEACRGNPVVFDLALLGDNLRGALVRAITICLERICGDEVRDGTKRFPYLVADEAHSYIKEEGVINLITRTRHMGIATIFVTNSPEKLPEPVWRQADNIVVTGLTHDADIRAVSKTSHVDKETIETIATRLPRHHALVAGRMTDGYPLVVSVDALPPHVPASGVTKSTWTRFAKIIK